MDWSIDGSTCKQKTQEGSPFGTGEGSAYVDVPVEECVGDYKNGCLRISVLVY